MRERTAGSIVVLLLATCGCSTDSRRRPAAPPPQPPRQAAVTPQNPNPVPLPTGWAWPFDVRQVPAALVSYGAVRPINLARIAPFQNRDACAPVQVASSVWFAPTCTTHAQRLNASTAIPVRRFQRSIRLTLPASVDLRTQGLDGPVKYQQMVGVCWTFAISTTMENSLRRQGRTEVIAPLHVLASDTWDNIWRYGRSEDKLIAEESWPYDPVKACKLNEAESERWCGEAYEVTPGSWRTDPTLVAEVNRANAGGVHYITSVEQLEEPTQPDQVASLLAQGQAIFVNFDINRDAWSEQGGVGPRIPDYTTTDAGHAVVFVGYRPAGAAREFLIHNSWSAEWRDGGYAWISEAMVRQHAHDTFVVEVASAAAPGSQPLPGPSPTPGPEPPGSQCPAGQQRDVVFGTCRPACPSGSPAVAGFCPPGSAASACPPGQLTDFVTRQCAPQCGNGLPSAAGFCAP